MVQEIKGLLLEAGALISIPGTKQRWKEGTDWTMLSYDPPHVCLTYGNKVFKKEEEKKE